MLRPILKAGMKISRSDPGLYQTCPRSDNKKSKKEAYVLQV
jgi:hypothetical protein